MNRYQQSGHGLGTDIVLTINGDKSDETALFEQLWAQIQHFENQFSRFKTTSEVSKLNAHAGLPIVMTEDFIVLLRAAIAASKETDGVYNPLVLGALQRAGYKGSWPHVDALDSDLDYTNRTTFANASAIRINGNKVTIPADTALDFGGIGKGFLLDSLADFLDTKHVKHYWLSLGGDIVVRGHDVTNKPWQIGIGDVQEVDKVNATVTNADGSRVAIATSGITKRQGTGWHHLINPATQKPAETDLASVTVIHPHATAADVLAKCLVILGSKSLDTFASQHDIQKAFAQTLAGDTLQYEANHA